MDTEVVFFYLLKMMLKLKLKRTKLHHLVTIKLSMKGFEGKGVFFSH